MNLEDWLERKYREYDRDYRESEDFEEYEQAAYEKGRRDAYYAVLEKMKKEETNESYEGIH